MTDHATLRQRYGYLPDNMRRLLEVTGDEDLMLRVVARCRGRVLTVPRRLTAKSQLVVLLGQADAHQVWLVFGRNHGDIRLEVPMLSSTMVRAREDRILSLAATGLTLGQIAARVQMTTRGVRKALRRAEARGHAVPTAQLDMFPAR